MATAIAGIALAFATPLGGVVPLICAVLVALSVGYKLQGLYFVRDIQPAAREQKLFLWLSVFPAILAGAAAAWLANLRDNSVLESWAALAVTGVFVYGLTTLGMRVWGVTFPEPDQPRPTDKDPPARPR